MNRVGDGCVDGESTGRGLRARRGQTLPIARRLTDEQRSLVAAHLGLVGVHLRQRVGFSRRDSVSREHDDLFQTGCLALVMAAAEYDPARHGPFAPYVFPRIRRAVHKKLVCEQSPVRLPYGVACRRDPACEVRCGPLSLHQGRGCGPPLQGCDAAGLPPAGDTIGHAIRERFQVATRAVLDRLGTRAGGRRDYRAIFSRVTEERILVPNARERTPVRRLGRELGVSSGQVTQYEHQVMRALQEEFGADLQVRLLLRFARQDPAGFDGHLDDERCRRLLAADLRAFEKRFAGLDRSQQAATLLALVEQSTGQVSRVARHLYQLTRGTTRLS